MVNPFVTLGRSALVSMLSVGWEAYQADAGTNRLFYDGDHWQGGSGWMGPMPAPDGRPPEEIAREVMRVFCSKNAIREVIDRRVSGLYSNDLTYRFTHIEDLRPDQDMPEEEPFYPEPATPEEVVAQERAKQEDEQRRYKQRIAKQRAKKQRDNLCMDAQRLFEDWAKERKLQDTMRDVYRRALLGEFPILRVYIPRGLIEADGAIGTVPSGTLEDMLKLVHVEVAHSGAAGELVDRDTQAKALFYNTTTNDQTNPSGTSKSYAELVTLSDGNTVLRTFVDNEEYTWVWDLNGHMTMHKVDVAPLITEQIRQNQRSLNMVQTMQNRNNVAAGFVERIITDAMPPGRWIDDPSNPGKQKYELMPFRLGGGTTNFLLAAEYTDSTGANKRGTPNVFFRDPVKPDTFIASKRDNYQNILEEAGQSHVLIAGDPTTSGISRKQARDEFDKTLQADRAGLQNAVSWLMDTVLALAGALSNQTVTFRDIRASHLISIANGPLTEADRAELREDVKAGIKSVRWAMVRDGISDPDAEMEVIRREQSAAIDLVRSRAETMQLLTSAGSSVYAAAIAVGFTEDEARRFEDSGFLHKEPTSRDGLSLMDAENPPMPGATQVMDTASGDQQTE